MHNGGLFKGQEITLIKGLSIIIITRNEELDIEDCLKSVAGIADEVVLVDSGSTDKTVEIARRYTQKISHRDWEGYGPQKQFALDKAQGPWILNVDADERVTPALAREIENLLSNENFHDKNGFEIPFRHYFLGRRLRFGGVQGETHLRLFKKVGAHYGGTKIHEGIYVPPPFGRCRFAIDHFSYRDINEYKRKRDEYTTLIAEQKHAKGDRFHFWHHMRLPFEFVIRYFFKLGFLDGVAGLRYAWLSSVYVWMKFTKLRDIQVPKK